MERKSQPPKRFGKPSNSRTSRPGRSRPEKSGPRNDRTRSDRPGSSRPLRAKPDRVRRVSPIEEPEIPAEITGEELPRQELFQFQSLAQENAERVKKHLVALSQFLLTDPERAFRHGQAAAFRAGRIALVRERAGIAGVESGHFIEAQKDLRAASRISGSVEVLPYIARCEVALGNPRKALEIAGSVDQKKLTTAGRVMMRIAASQARRALNEPDAAVLTLQCSELNTKDASWSRALHREYRDALVSAKRESDALAFESKFPESFQPLQN